MGALVLAPAVAGSLPIPRFKSHPGFWRSIPVSVPRFLAIVRCLLSACVTPVHADRRLRWEPPAAPRLLLYRSPCTAVIRKLGSFLKSSAWLGEATRAPSLLLLLLLLLRIKGVKWDLLLLATASGRPSSSNASRTER